MFSSLEGEETTRFSQCELCFQFKKALADATSMEVKLGALVAYRQHLASQYADRTLLWSMQELGSDPMGDLMICQLDGMDQGKFRLPRDPQLKATASLAKFIRPKLKVHGVWFFGYSLELHIMDESLKHDGSCINEVLARGIERVCELSERRALRVPSKLIICGDNTVRELKNQINLAYVAALIGHRKLQMICLMFLRKSHTHDRIDQVWGILARRIANTDTLMDPEDTALCIQKELSRPGFRSFLGASTELNVKKLDAVRDWKSHWQSLGVSLGGGLLEDASGNHFFLMLRRQGRFC